MDRREFLGVAGVASLGASLAPEAQAEGYRRCDQLHEKLTEADVDKWVVELEAPGVALQIPAEDIQPPIGEVAQGVAPEWYWFHSDRPFPQMDPPLAPGAFERPRKDDIYRAADAAEAYTEMDAVDFVDEVIPGWVTHQLGYSCKTDKHPGEMRPSVPGPTHEVRLGHPLIVRVTDKIDPNLMLDVSVHQHGGHTPAHSDGHPNFLILPAEPAAEDPKERKPQSRDYFYPNPVPLKVKQQGAEWKPQVGQWDFDETPSTMWYHDHAEDITAHNALMGLGGLFLLRDPVEDALRGEKILPQKDHEIPLVFKDVCFCPIRDRDMMTSKVHEKIKELESTGRRIQGEARIHFDPFDHNGTLGNLVLVSGKLFPVKHVAAETYWLRMLNASLARFYNLEFWVIHPATRIPRRVPFLRFGRDSWMFKNAREASSVFLAMANRADVMIDFGKLHPTLDPSWAEYWHGPGGNRLEVMLVSTLNQKDGRGPGHGDNEQTVNGFPRGMADEIRDDRKAPMELVKFVVTKEPEPKPSNCVMTTLQELRPHEPLPIPENVVVREFNFERGRGAWQINHRFYDSCIANAVPSLWSTELWILRNRSGGWWHPIHIHLESQQHLYVKARNHRGEHIVVSRDDYDPRVFLKERGIECEFNQMAAELGEQTANSEWEAAKARWKESFSEMTLEERHDAGLSDFDSSVWDVGIKHDTNVLGPNTEIHLLMRFRTFEGPFVFHCHNLNHEDMRMMYQMDPRDPKSRGGESVPDEHLSVRKDYWYFASKEDHCCNPSTQKDGGEA